MTNASDALHAHPRLREVAALFLRLGLTAFGGPAAHIAIGQVTPGPVFTTATFIGYFLGGLPGALLATRDIFLPSFIFVALVNPLVPHLRHSTWAGALLDGVNVVA